MKRMVKQVKNEEERKRKTQKKGNESRPMGLEGERRGAQRKS